MATAKHTTAPKPAKSAAKPLKKGDPATPFDALIASTKPPLDREAIRAARYPQAAKQEAERKAAAAKKATSAPSGVARAKFNNSVEFKSAVVKPGAKFYGIAASERPSKGARLYAHTHAVLGAFGMFATPSPAIPAGNLVTLLGNTAVSYHITQRNLERAPNNEIRLTSYGRDFFNKRVQLGYFDMALANAFAALIVTGKASDDTGVTQSAVFSHQP